jgi:hypothetical protein
MSVRASTLTGSTTCSPSSRLHNAVPLRPVRSRPVSSRPARTERASRTSTDEPHQARRIGTSVCAEATGTGNLRGVKTWIDDVHGGIVRPCPRRAPRAHMCRSVLATRRSPVLCSVSWTLPASFCAAVGRALRDLIEQSVPW